MNDTQQTSPQDEPSPRSDPYPRSIAGQQRPPDPVTVPRRSRALGAIAFVLVLTSLALFTSVTIQLLTTLSPEAFLANASGLAIAGIATGCVGFGLSIVAVVTRRGRLWGAFGLIGSLLVLPLAWQFKYFVGISF